MVKSSAASLRRSSYSLSIPAQLLSRLAKSGKSWRGLSLVSAWVASRVRRLCIHLPIPPSLTAHLQPPPSPSPHPLSHLPSTPRPPALKYDVRNSPIATPASPPTCTFPLAMRPVPQSFSPSTYHTTSQRPRFACRPWSQEPARARLATIRS